MQNWKHNETRLKFIIYSVVVHDNSNNDEHRNDNNRDNKHHRYVGMAFLDGKTV